MSGKINEFLSFYGALGRPLTFVEIMRLSGGEPVKIRAFLDKEIKSGAIIENDGFFILKKFKEKSGLGRRLQDFLLDQKWRKLLEFRKWFKYIPFLDFVMASGSMAMGNVTDHSDFDVLVGVSSGRIFTARYATLLIFTLLGVRRPDDKAGSSPDKLCFNHFVTAETYSKPPYNLYRSELCKNMVPIYGSRENIQNFFILNDWTGISADSLLDERFQPQKPSFLRLILEFILGGKVGDYLEQRIIAPIAKKRLGEYIGSRPQGGRVVVSDKELEFHFNLPYEV